MRHTLLAGVRVRTGVVRGYFCYQPFVGGRLRKAVPLFADLGSAQANQSFFEAYYEPIVSVAGNVVIGKREEK